jgi:hypothetical protein
VSDSSNFQEENNMDEHPLFRKRALEKLQAPEQLDQLLSVTSPRSWLALLAISGLLIAAVLWSVLATVEVTLPGSGVLVVTENEAGQFEAVIFVTIEDARRIHPGMTARIAPATVRKEEYGLLQGRVTAVNQQPSTQMEMIDILGNDAFVQFLAADGMLMAVRVALAADPSTPSGYQWTSAVGPPNTLREGTVATGSVVIRQQKPIELILPSSLKRLSQT